YENGEPTGEKEHWTLHEFKGGARFIRVDVDFRYSEHGGFSRLEEALYDPAGLLARYNFHYFDDSSNPPRELPAEVKADYTVLEGYLQIAYTAGHEAREYEEVTLPEKSVLSPHGFIFMGQVIHNAIAVGGDHIPVYDLDYHVYGSMAHPMQYTAEFITEETTPCGKRHIPTRCYSFSRADKAHERLYWLDEHDIVIKYEYRHGDEQQSAQLGNYAHR
ncbi:MAG: hypothetical protein ACPG7F_14255, partial [Aggregatilineales bacterium]